MVPCSLDQGSVIVAQEVQIADDDLHRTGNKLKAPDTGSPQTGNSYWLVLPPSLCVDAAHGHRIQAPKWKGIVRTLDTQSNIGACHSVFIGRCGCIYL